MATTALTNDTFEKSLFGKVDTEAEQELAAAAGLEQLISADKALEMDDVRATTASRL